MNAVDDRNNNTKSSFTFKMKFLELLLAWGETFVVGKTFFDIRTISVQVGRVCVMGVLSIGTRCPGYVVYILQETCLEALFTFEAGRHCS